jgi:GT2 family glycosyltransferase
MKKSTPSHASETEKKNSPELLINSKSNSQSIESLRLALEKTSQADEISALHICIIANEAACIEDYLKFAIFLRDFDLSNSLKVLDEAQDKFGKNAWIEDNRARAFVLLENLNDAVNCWEKACNMVTEEEKKFFVEQLYRVYGKLNKQIAQEISYAKNNRNWDAVLSILNSYKIQQPNNLFIYLELSIAYRNTGNFINALKTLKSAQKQGLQSSWIHDNYARIYIEKELYQQAVEEIKLALKLTSSEIEIQVFNTLLENCQDKCAEDEVKKQALFLLCNNQNLTILANKHELSESSSVELLIDSEKFEVIKTAMINQPALLNVNQIWDSDFELGGRCWQNSSKIKSENLNIDLSETWRLEEGHTAYLYQAQSNKEAIELVYHDPVIGELLPVIQGSYYEIGGSFACHRCESALIIEFYNDELERHEKKEFTIASDTLGGTHLKDYVYIEESIFIPENISFVRISLLKLPKKTGSAGNDSYLFFAHPFFTLVASESASLGWNKNPLQLPEWRQLRYSNAGDFLGLTIQTPSPILDTARHNIELNSILIDNTLIKLSKIFSNKRSNYHWQRFRINIAEECKHKNWAKAVQLVDGWINKNPHDTEIGQLPIITRVDKAKSQGIFDLPTVEVLQLTRYMTELKPTKVWSWKWLIEITYLLHRWQESLTAYNNLTKLSNWDDTNDEYLIAILAAVFEKFYRYEEAFHFYLRSWAANFEESYLEKLVEIVNNCEHLQLSNTEISWLCTFKFTDNQSCIHILTLTEAIIPRLSLVSLDELLNQTNSSHEAFFSALIKAFEQGEQTYDWSLALTLLEALDKANILNPLPDWLAIEILWMSVQFSRLALMSDKKTVALAKKNLAQLKLFQFWQHAITFDKKFPLLDQNYLLDQNFFLLEQNHLLHQQTWTNSTKITITSLSEFLAHPNSFKIAPHILFSIQWYKDIAKLIDDKVTHPLVHFFRYSSGYVKKSLNPNPYFDCNWYRKKYLENNNIDNPLLHYLANFQQTGLQPSKFFCNDYVRETQGLLTTEEPLSYYLEQLINGGIGFCLNGFSPSAFFDRKFYAERNGDLLPLVHQHQLDLFAHFINYGQAEGRQSYPWQLYNEFVRHQRLYLEPFNWNTRLGSGDGGVRYTIGKKAETAYLAGQTVLAKDFAYRPLISILVPVYQVSPRFLEAMIQSVIAQTYELWQLCLVDDSSKRYRDEIIGLLEKYAAKDQRIVYTVREKNGHICHTTNDCLTLAQGEYVALLDHDDLLTPDALYEVVSAINQNNDLDIIYSDEDKVDEWGVFSAPYYKPDWSPHSLWARMYVCHLTVYRKSLVDSVKGFRVGFEGSQDYDLLLRCTEHTKNIHHIPRVLYHWRAHSESTASGGNNQAKNYCAEAGRKAVEEALQRRGIKADVSSIENMGTAILVKPTVIGNPLVDIIIPSRNGTGFLKTCLQSIFKKTSYLNFKITVIDNNSTDDDFFELVEYWQQQESERFQVIRDESPFNFARLNNSAVEKTDGDYLLFLNNDTEVITKDWIEGMLGYAQLEEAGAVGIKLYYEDDTIQHAGVATGIQAIAGHVMKHAKREAHGYYSNLKLVTNYSAVTAACLMINRKKFNLVGGFTEYLQVAFNDIDFCLKVRQQGFYNIYLPFVELYHYESKSRGYEDTPEKEERFERETLFLRQRWGKQLDNDPFYSPWLTLDSESMGYRFH